MWAAGYLAQQVCRFGATAVDATRLTVANFGEAPRIPAAGPVLISLTTHGDRINTVYLAIESLARGSLKAPIVLWLEPADYERAWPDSLRRLVARGLVVRRATPGLGPHTKYFDAFREQAANQQRVVIVDDDVIYPRWFLAKLVKVARLRTDTIVAYRAHRIELSGDELMGYRFWSPANTSEASILHFATGVSGVCFPPGFIAEVAACGTEFLDCAPRADDVWLHRCALRSGYRVRQVFARPRNFPVIPMAQATALVRANVGGGGNDQQIARTYSARDIESLAAAARRED